MSKKIVSIDKSFTKKCIESENDYNHLVRTSNETLSSSTIVIQLNNIGSALHKKVSSEIDQETVEAHVFGIFNEIAKSRIDDNIIAEGHDEVNGVILRAGIAYGILSGFADGASDVES